MRRRSKRLCWGNVYWGYKWTVFYIICPLWCKILALVFPLKLRREQLSHWTLISECALELQQPPAWVTITFGTPGLAGGNELLNLPTQAGYYLSLLSCNLSTSRWCMCRCILDLVNIALFFRQQRQCWQTLYAASTMQRRRTAKSCIDGWEVLNRKVCLSYHVSWCLKICNHEMAPVLYDSKKNTIVIYY